jgi:ABC-type transport system involved in cytochrome bd biosynthesis fused ATPase/permease subunit
MEQLFKTISNLLDFLYFEVISPCFVLVARGLDILLIQPLQFLHIPPVLQIMFIAFLTGMLSMVIRHFLHVEEKEAVFKATFTKKKDAQDDLKLISDWKSRETFAKTIDDDIDQDFNSYLAERFARHGMVYLLPIFLSLFWLENALESSGILFYLPKNRFGVEGIYPQFVFLLTYCLVLVTYFRLRRKKRKISD